MNENISIFWFRRDLRLKDNIGFLEALKSDYPVLPIFIFDTKILDKLPTNDARVTFIHKNIQKMRDELHGKFGSSIALYHGNPIRVFEMLLQKYIVHSVYVNNDYEPYARERDTAIKELLKNNGIAFKTFKDHVIFEKDEVIKDNGHPYIIYTPYKKKWKQHLDASKHLKAYNPSENMHNLIRNSRLPNVSLLEMGFETSTIKVQDYVVTSSLIQNYKGTRNYPAKMQGTSQLGPHLRFGTVSIREIAKNAIAEENEVFLDELIWREFFMQILWHFPQTVTRAFKPKYDYIKWRNNEEEFEKWKKGKTGYPLIDAGIRELNSTGYMHNRVRMLVASFLCKHLLIDWRWGEAYFAEKLLDFDLSANIGNWQWAAGSGVDAAPYFRIFNPTIQMEKFDKQREYIHKWIPELQELTYPSKMVDHKMARERCLKAYKEAVG